MTATTQLEVVLKARDEASSKIKDFYAKSTDASKKFAMAVGAGLAAATTAVTAFGVKSINEYSRVGDEIEKMSKRTGIAAEAISGLRVAADMGGTSIETVENALKKMSVNLAEAEKQGSTLGDVIVNRIGLSIDEFRKARPEEQFEILAQSIGSVKDPSEKAKLAFDVFGKSGIDLIPLMEDGSFSMQKWSDEAKRLGVSFDDLSASKAAQLNDALGAMETAFSGVSLTIGSAFAPIIIPLAEKVTELVNGFSAWIDEIGGVQGALERIKSFLDEHKLAISLIAGAIFGAMIPAFIALATTILFSVIPAFFGAMVTLAPFMIGGAIIAGIVLGITWLIQNWEMLQLKVTEIWEAIVKWVSDKISDLQTALFEKADAIKNGFVEKWTAIKDFIKSIWDGIKNTIGGAIDWIIRKIQALIDKMNDLASAMANSAVGKVVGGIVNAGKGAISAVGSLFRKAGGGSVIRGTPYIVGERGPEVFTPNVSGRITPNAGIGGGGITVVIQGNSFMGDEDMAVKIGDMIVNRLKLVTKIAI